MRTTLYGLATYLVVEEGRELATVWDERVGATSLKKYLKSVAEGAHAKELQRLVAGGEAPDSSPTTGDRGGEWCLVSKLARGAASALTSPKAVARWNTASARREACGLVGRVCVAVVPLGRILMIRRVSSVAAATIHRHEQRPAPRA